MLSTVEFTEARRGADRNEVASFLRELARGVATLERQLAETTARADKAEQRLREVGSDDEIRRTLVLAQRTADGTLAEATAEGQRLVAAAEQRAAHLVAEAEAQAEQTRATAAAESEAAVAEAKEHAAAVRAEGEAEAKQATEELRNQLRQQVVDLGERRSSLSEDVSRLEDHLAAQRRRMQSVISTLSFLVDNPEALAELEAPPQSDIDLTGLMEDPGSKPAEPSEAQLSLADVPVQRRAPKPEAEAEAEPAPEVLDLTDATAETSRSNGDIDWSEIPVIDGLSSSDDDPITAEVPVTVGDRIVIDARDDILSDSMSSRASSAAAHDERRRRFGRSR
ncbi:MAG: hypothetical protein JWL70_787 [Acidimicrobiia bacterium]|nr:hypothetical protein [Acidimicrobiia bacterium]